MTKERKPIPPPVELPRRPFEMALDERYPIPFMLANPPRMMLNFLAMHSAIPDAYRNLIAQWLLEYDASLSQYIAEQFGVEGLHDAHFIAVAMAEGFLEAIRESRDEADREMFTNLDREVFGDEKFPDDDQPS